MRARMLALASCLVAATSLAGATLAQNGGELRPPSAFAGVADRAARSRLLFAEAAKVIMNPRCVNCHPASDRPTQGNDMHPHVPAAARGPDGGGVPGNTCGACHMDRNVDILAGQETSFQSIPGHPRWGLANGVGGQVDERDLPAHQGAGAQRRPRSRVAARASRAR